MWHDTYFCGAEGSIQAAHNCRIDVDLGQSEGQVEGDGHGDVGRLEDEGTVVVGQAEVVVEVGGDAQRDSIGNDQPDGTVQIGLHGRRIGLLLIDLHHIQEVVPPEEEGSAQFVPEHFGGHSEDISVLSASAMVVLGVETAAGEGEETGRVVDVFGRVPGLVLVDGLVDCFEGHFLG
jgi:hypothetical protein